MKWHVLFVVLFAFICSIMADDDERAGFDYTGHYAELAAPVPSHVNIDELIASLRAASNLP